MVRETSLPPINPCDFRHPGRHAVRGRERGNGQYAHVATFAQINRDQRRCSQTQRERELRSGR
jgi:hypothetical protein